MFGLFKRKSDEISLDEELKKEVPPPPPPPVKYIYTIHSESETFDSEALTYAQCIHAAQNICVYGSALIQEGKLKRYLPPHRVYEITFKEQE